MKCRFCNTSLIYTFADLVSAPPSNDYLTEEQLKRPEVFYPLKALVCHSCFLVQIDEFQPVHDHFSADYAYFSSYSSSWLNHAARYVEMIVEKLSLTESSSVVEIASNDGYLLQYMKKKGIPCLGIEPAAGTAMVAIEKGIQTLQEFFGKDLAIRLKSENKKFDLIIGNNVLAHVPDICDFVEGLSLILAENGTITMEFPHLMKLITENQFDTIYHEHFSYLSFSTVRQIFDHFGLTVYDVEQLPTHGGSLRIYVKNSRNIEITVKEHVDALCCDEKTAGMRNIEFYKGFQTQIDRTRDAFLAWLLNEKRAGRRVVAYGAAAKGNTLLNYCGIRGSSLIEYVVDASPHKQGKFLPGSHIPVVNESRLKESKPDRIVILPWNLKEEIKEQLRYVREWGAEFVTVVPDLQVAEI
ncbi:MAG: SAM-dependent methyltransferase [Candidatus Wallbacteria bacterium HGW-Wallbacteria-1]|jgi:SAM-dependent methyltransferase|uniref:SAM-dependent methyltransferase n=1 Tax=Candidatus Wallbacteria bacterium HGW-Wallbacteria-1 TaxID=2013854 RepID=A0A2N1PN85_9BACT|nr:MAG: SAM-dependent methyltransferase [Candidatus Wallbacteria bacterium HGW-Wallbacteria-1]